MGTSPREERISNTIGRLHPGNTGRYIIGTPADVVDDMQEWMEAGAADGFNLCPPTLPQGIEDFVELVLPELHKRDLFRREYEGATLRENLGLKPLVHPARASRVLKAS
ncbi:MAG TPA: hypothetical protein PKE13_07130 [Hyphomicrobium zavarzinii]|nr:hypothetical protein [Hyphomicrobium zavarzinii]